MFWQKFIVGIVILCFAGFGCDQSKDSIIENQATQIDHLNAQLNQPQPESPEVKIERCNAIALIASKDAIEFIKEDEEDELGRKALQTALQSCQNLSSNSLRFACSDSTTERFYKLREELKVRYYNKYYAECLSK